MLWTKDHTHIFSSIIFTFEITFEFFKEFGGVLEIMFPTHGVMDALGIVYSQY